MYIVGSIKSLANVTNLTNTLTIKIQNKLLYKFDIQLIKTSIKIEKHNF